MKKLRDITIVSYFDDNYGDMLIKESFECLLKTVLDNIGVLEYETHRMHLKKIDEGMLKKTDLICFAGGGLFGLSYLNFYEYLKEIMDIAEANEIPVIFSSMGINNMDYVENDDNKLREILKHKCIKAISVRENQEWFQKYLRRKDLRVETVCDPALWAQYLFPHGKRTSNNEKLRLGINVVRNNLFIDNGYTWDAEKQFAYLDKLVGFAKKQGYDYVLYTNGSLADNRALKDYVETNKISSENYRYTETTHDLMTIISSCDFVCAIRLHSAIIATAYERPSITVVWNEKIPFFYKNIGLSEYAISEEMAECNDVEQIIEDMIGEKIERNTEYLESLYKYLFNNICRIAGLQEDIEMFSFQKVGEKLGKFYKENQTVYLMEDYEFKDSKLVSNYFKLDNKVQEKNRELFALKKENAKLLKDNKKMKADLDRIYSKLLVRIYRKIKRMIK